MGFFTSRRQKSAFKGQNDQHASSIAPTDTAATSMRAADGSATDMGPELSSKTNQRKMYSHPWLKTKKTKKGPSNKPEQPLIFVPTREWRECEEQLVLHHGFASTMSQPRPRTFVLTDPVVVYAGVGEEATFKLTGKTSVDSDWDGEPRKDGTQAGQTASEDEASQEQVWSQAPEGKTSVEFTFESNKWRLLRATIDPDNGESSDWVFQQRCYTRAGDNWENRWPVVFLQYRSAGNGNTYLHCVFGEKKVKLVPSACSTNEPISVVADESTHTEAKEQGESLSTGEQ